MKIRIPVVVLIPIIIVIAVLCTRCAKKDNEVKEENAQKIETVSRGEWNENQYNNDFIKLKFNLQNGWNKYSDEELAKLMNIEEEKLHRGATEIAELAEKQPVHVMVVNDPSTGAKVMIMLEKVTSEINEERYVNKLKRQLEADKTMNNEVSKIYTEMISNIEYKALKVEMYDYNTEQIYYIRKQGEYIINIVITTAQEGQQEQILKYFE